MIATSAIVGAVAGSVASTANLAHVEAAAAPATTANPVPVRRPPEPTGLAEAYVGRPRHVPPRLAPPGVEAQVGPGPSVDLEAASIAEAQAEADRVLRAFHREYDSQIHDSAWSMDVRNAVDTYVENVPTSVEVLSVDCRSSLCRLDVLHDEPDAQHLMFLALRDTPSLSGPAFMHREVTAAGNYASVFIVARPGHQLPAM